MMKHTATLLPLALLLLTSIACRGPIPCDNCEDNAAENADEDPPPDLPCGGADLLTDDLNCGSCGNECVVWEKDTQWEAGGCRDGVCGPRWVHCESAGTTPAANCEEICTAWEKTCVAQGCAELTALVFAVGFDDNCNPQDNPPVQELVGSCTDPLPWMTTDEYSHEISCCCG